MGASVGPVGALAPTSAPNQFQPPVDGAGFPVAPTTVVAGGLATIPYPTAKVGPVPIPLPYAVLLNSSPYTLLVSSGGAVRQVAAFTADIVNVTPGAQVPLTVLAQAGAGPVVGGQDSTVYTTWYATRPDGAYPAALGSGAVALEVTRSLVNSSFVGAGTTQFGPLDLGNFAGVSVRFVDLGGGGSVTAWQLQFQWLDGGGNFIAQETVIAGPSGTVQMARPAMGAQLTLFVSAVGGGGPIALVNVMATLFPFSGFVTPLGAQLLQVQGFSMPAGGGFNTVADTINVFGGQVTVNASAPSNTSGYTVLLSSMNNAGVFTNLARFTATSGAVAINETLMLPACPIRARAANQDGSARNLDVAISALTLGTG